MTDDRRNDPMDDPADDAGEHLAADIRRALLEPVAVNAAARDRAIAAALAEFDRSGLAVVDLETARRQRYSRSLSAAAAVLLVAVGISVVAPDGGDDSDDTLEMSAEPMAAESDGGVAEVAGAPAVGADESSTAMTHADDSMADSAEKALDEPAEEPALEALPVEEQLRMARNPAELQDLAVVWWERIRAGVADPPSDHSCLVAGSSPVAIADYLGVDVVVFYDGASDAATALNRSDCSPVDRGLPSP